MKRWPWLGLVVLLAAAPFSLVLAALATATPEEPEAEATPGMRTLYLVRHGYYDFQDPADPRVGKRLTDLGRKQARLVAQRLNSLPVTFAAVRTSTFMRAMETGDVIGKVLGLEVTRDAALNECTPASSRPEVLDEGPAAAAAARTQLEAAWARYARPSPDGDLHEVIAGHGNVIRWFVTKAIGADTRQWANMDIAHCGLTIVTINPDGSVRLVTFNDLGHLPPAKLTWAGQGPGW